MPKHFGGPSYTRHKYIRSIPQSMIKHFTLGDSKSEFSHLVLLKASFPAEIGSGAIEAARVTANKVLEKAGKPFLLQIFPYPHEVVREHKFMGFAGADRLSRGMSKSFGRPVGRTAKIDADQIFLTISINASEIEVAKMAVKRAAKKLSSQFYTVVEAAPTSENPKLEDQLLE